MRALVSKGRYGEAAARVAEALRFSPDCSDLLAEHVWLLRAAGFHHKAKAATDVLASRHSDHPRLPQLRGELAESTGDFKEAERIWREHVAARPDDARRRALWARALVRLERFNEALGVLGTGLTASSSSVELLQGKAEAFTSMARWSDAEHALAALAERRPDHAKLPTLRLKLAEARGDASDAERICAEAAAARPGHVGWQVRWARALKRLDRADDALAVLSDATGGDHAAGELLAERAALMLAASRPEAAAAVEALAASSSDHPKLASLQARCLELAEDFRGAALGWVDHLAAHPRDAHGRVRLARCLTRLDRLPDALDALLTPDGVADGELVAERVGLLYRMGRLEDSEVALNALIASDPRHPLVEKLRGALASARGDHDRAVLIYAADTTQHPHDVLRRLRWVRGLARLGRHKAALDALDSGLRDEPRQPELMAERVAVQIAGGDLAAAAVNLATLEGGGDTRNPRVLQLRGQLAQARGDLDSARDAFASDAASHPNDRARRVRLLRFLQQTGQITEALAQLSARPPRDLPEWQLWIDCLLEAGRWDEATTRLAAWPHADMRGRLMKLRFEGELAAMRFDHAAAIACARSALAIAPDDHTHAQALARSAVCTFQLDLASNMLAKVRIRGATGAGPARRGVGRLRHLVGQMINEFRLRPRAIAALAEASAANDDDTLIATAAVCLRTDPGDFAAALALLTGLARSGRLTTGQGGARALVPSVLHQYWDSGTAPADIERAIAHTAEINADLEHRRWDDAMARRFLAEVKVPGVQQAYARARHPAMRCDLFRLAVLHEVGGIYLDADDYGAQPLSSLIKPGAELVCYQENIGSIGNNFIAVVPRHPVIGEALTEAVRSVLAGASESLWLVTGPGLMSRVVANWIARQPNCLPPQILQIVPLQMFRQTVHTLRTASYKADVRSWKRLG